MNMHTRSVESQENTTSRYLQDYWLFMDITSAEEMDSSFRNQEAYYLSLFETLNFFFLAENKRFTEFNFTTGNDLETSKVPLSVLSCIIEKNAYYECKGSKISKLIKNRDIIF